MMEEIKRSAALAMAELLERADLAPGALVVVGCSSSEILGEMIGKAGSPEAARAVLDGILPLLEEKGLYLAAQCCEHLNRALVVPRRAAEALDLEQVCARPRAKAGGSFATAAYERLEDPVLVESVRAMAGLDIGGTLIGMHLRAVAIPVRLAVKSVGQAHLAAAITRPRLIGGVRAEYPEKISWR